MQAEETPEVDPDEKQSGELGENASTGNEPEAVQPGDRIAELEREVLRSRAELENFRKRMQRDMEQQLKYSNLPLIRELLDVIDNLRRAIEASGNSGGENEQALRKGVEMVTEQMASTLSKYGCQPIVSLGTEFDPNLHEAIAQMPSEEHPKGAVAQEVAVGYRLFDRVVRPSNVIVSSGSAVSNEGSNE